MSLQVLLPLLIKLGLALLLSLLSLFGASAQDVPAGSRKIHIKMLKQENGKTVVLDTTLTAADDAALAEAIKGVRADTAILRALKNSRISIDRTSSLEGKLRDAKVFSIRSQVADSAMQQALKKAKVHIYRLDTTMVSAERKALFERISTLNQDTALIWMGKPLQLEIKNMPRMEHVIIFRKGDSLSMNNINQSYRITGNPDSVLLNRFKGADFKALDPSSIERIIVHKQKPGSKTDTITVRTPAEHIKFYTDKESGQKRIIRIDETGNAQEINTFETVTTPDFSRTIIIVNSSIKEITAEDKKALKAAGAPVETSPKEELKLEEVSYYPNPNQGRFHLSFTPAQKGNTQIRVLDMSGRIVFTEEVKKLDGAYDREIDISKFGRGVYFVQVAQGKRYFTRKIVVQ